jgi:hypothetical protein
MEFDKLKLDQIPKSGYGNIVPPLLDHVKIIFDQQELPENDAIKFYNHFQERSWQTKTGVSIKNWKQVLDGWIWDIKTRKIN